MLQPLTHLPREPEKPAPPDTAARREEQLWIAIRLADSQAPQALESFAAWCGRITPLVCLDPPETLLLEVRGSLRLFGSLAAVERRLTAEIAARRLSFHLCAAPTYLGALWLVRRQGENVPETRALAGSLGPLPLSVTHWPEDILTLLNEMGVRRIGDCLRLPRDGFARRIGRRYLRELDRALGKRPDPRVGFEKPRNLSSKIDFTGETDDRGLLAAALGKMVERLVDRLRSRQAQARELAIVLHHANRPPTVSGPDLMEPVHEASRLFDPLAARLESIVLPAPVIAIGLRAGALKPMHPKPPALFGKHGQAHGRPVSKAGLIERLRGRFGMEGVYGFELAAEHRPESGWTRLTGRLLETSSAGTGRRPASPLAGTRRLADRPLWILPSPLPLAQGAARLRFRGALQMGPEPERIEFSLDELRYEYPRELVPGGRTPTSHLRVLTEEGARQRWPEGVPDKVTRLVEHELALIGELRYEPYFLTVHDIVRFAREQGILCQGRGSAANSAVCFCLGITEVDPARMEMLVERFISKERNEPPDIDVDFEHERREEVIQYIYGKYSRERAALAATVITYRSKSAIRDVGKALGFEPGELDVLARSLHWWDRGEVDAGRVAEAGLDPASPGVRRLLSLAESLLGFPRHLSQHVGGFVISERPLCELAPIENAAMPERTVIQWDKDDLEELGLLKVDVLGLGMLSAIRKSFELIRAFHGRELSMDSIPAEDPEVYRMISKADTVGVFQIESRAQMAMLPRLRPRSYYDLVIEVAIIRPGPIQGDMVHPYLRRRNGEEPVNYPSEGVRKVLERTLGVPIFQEQVMQLAIVAAGFTPGEADRLRRAMAAWRRRGDLEPMEERLIQGMLERGYQREFAERIFNQIRGFGEYGFPESHAASFALLAYVSAWLKCHEPAVFFCALLNSLPMGFYAPAQLVRAAREQGVDVRPVAVTRSCRDSSLERDGRGEPAIRLGLRIVKGFTAQGGKRLVEARAEREFADVEDLARRAKLDAKDLGALAAAGALKPFAKNRHRARWSVAGIEKPPPLLERARIPEAIPMLKAPTEGEDIMADYRRLGLTLGRHPLALLRERLHAMGLLQARAVRQLEHGARVCTAGLVIIRQRPANAAGVTFVTVEDETGYVNLVVWENVASRERRTLLGAMLLGVEGRVQKEGEVLHVIADRLHDQSRLLGDLTVRSRDFR